MNNKKLTIDELIARKRQSEADKLQVKEVYIESLGGNILLKKGSISKVINLMDGISSEPTMKENYDFQRELVYEHCPILHDKALQDAYECVEPVDIVNTLFDENFMEISKISDEILDFYGLGDEKDTVKN